VKTPPRRRRGLVPRWIEDSPVLVRTVPFIIFLVLTFCQDAFGGTARYWFYVAKTVAAAWAIWEMWPWVEEMRWRVSLASFVVGFLAFAIWVWLDDLLRLLSIDPAFLKLRLPGMPWNPHEEFEPDWAHFFIGTRIAGSALVVPALEEVFYRSFLYRYIIKKDFERVGLGYFRWIPFIVTSVIFGFEHREWLTGILCGFLYQWLVYKKRRLGDAMTAHGITNLLLGIWVVWQNEWHFW
jgi:CAAX protease family protein